MESGASGQYGLNVQWLVALEQRIETDYVTVLRLRMEDNTAQEMNSKLRIVIWRLVQVRTIIFINKISWISYYLRKEAYFNVLINCSLSKLSSYQALWGGVPILRKSAIDLFSWRKTEI